MKQSAESSILKSLAIAFGDGLAFGVGMKLAQTSARQRAAAQAAQAVEPPAASEPPAPDVVPAETLDPQLLNRILSALDSRLADHVGKTERRLAETEAQLALEMKAFDGRQALQNSKAQAALEQIHAQLKAQIEQAEQSLEITLAERLQSALEPVIEQCVQGYVDSRIQELEHRLVSDITETGNRTAELLVQTIETRLLDRITILEGAVHQLQGKSGGSHQKLRDLLNGFSHACQTAMQELDESPKDDPPVAQQVEDHRFDTLNLVNGQPQSEHKWSIPIVSSLAIALSSTGLLAYMHLL